MILTISAAAIGFYAAGFYLQWQQLEPQVSAAPAWAKRIPLTIGALLCHAVASYTLLFAPAGFNLSVLVVTNLVAFVIIFVVALANTRLQVENLNLFLYPLAILVLLAVSILGPGNSAYSDMTWPLAGHILLSLAAYSTLMLAACQSGLLAIQEKHLKNRSFGVLQILPPLETMESLLLTMLWIGLILLSGSIVSGFLFLDNMFAQHVVHHTVLTTMSWIVYVVFLAGRHLLGWRGLTAVRWTLVGFALLVIGYLGSKFVLEYLLS